MKDQDVDVDLAEARKELAVWQPADQFIRKVEKVGGLVESALLFNKPNVGFLLDAMVLAEFAGLRDTPSVRLAGEGDQWPDGQIGVPKCPIHIEITEVMEPGRKRGDEYRKANQSKDPVLDPVEKWRERGAMIPDALEEAIKKKVPRTMRLSHFC